MRLKRGLRQKDVAPILGVNPWTLRNWEHTLIAMEG
ncbi:MAG: helix-turn-helix transcriptional regulator [Candidatus Thiodiazotropha sp. (ex Gloverina cf. vestifex)]|nr:helix-turn-helix transcriptional regulator [Candidatus Thiodiazotropha sp. (ex Gloverina cf. vestifex)]